MTKDVFDQIASGWYNYRHRSRFHHELETLAKRWQKGRLLNLGCAHGPDFVPFRKNFELYGVDFSGNMLRFALKYSKKYKFSVGLSQADIRFLPCSDDTFDWAIAVATYHHIDNRQERLQALLELQRVLKPGGEAFITVWNKWQPRFWLKSKNILVPWRTRDKIINRYYYLFSYSELEQMARKAGLEVLRSFPEKKYRLPVKTFSRNVCILVKKPG
jgi:tRNA (uracil-5-)-methyltransferase TRM9